MYTVVLDISFDDSLMYFESNVRMKPHINQCEELILKGTFVGEQYWRGRLVKVKRTNLYTSTLNEFLKEHKHIRTLDMSQCEGIESIEGFYDLNIENIVFPRKVQKLPHIWRCPNLKTIKGENLLEIRDIRDCPNVENVIFNPKIKILELNNTKISSITITPQMERYSFQECKYLRDVTIENGVKYMLDNSFVGCESLQKIYIPDNVSLGEKVFAKCKQLQFIRLPNDVEKIPSSFFSECSSLEKIVDGKNVKSIGKHAFLNCDSLNHIPFTLLNFNEDDFTQVNVNLLGIVLADSCSNLIWCFNDFSFYHFKGCLDIGMEHKIISFKKINNLSLMVSNSDTHIVRCPFKNAEDIYVIEDFNVIDDFCGNGKIGNAIRAYLDIGKKNIPSIPILYKNIKEKVELLNAKEIIGSYYTFVDESQTCKVGGDNTYHYIKKTHCDYMDAYFEKLLPQYDDEIHESSYHDYRDEIDYGISIKQAKIDDKIREKALRDYSQSEHIITLIDDYIRKYNLTNKMIEDTLHIEYAKNIVEYFFKYLYKGHKNIRSIGFLSNSDVCNLNWMSYVKTNHMTIYNSI